ncbi:BtpA/SgcQ family protein [Candidatus Azambacteria bacterium]|nr:BtpA/SgcQ family protein [Candidatus Azambacteria bacterium]
MDTKFKKIFNKEKGVIVGAIHFPPLLGFSEFPGFEIARLNALKDLEAFVHGGADAIVFENNYDIPHTEFVGPEICASMLLLGAEIKKATTLPVGISVLWNDYKTALSIAKVLDLQFIRIPVFVDTVKTSYGIIEGKHEEIMAYRKNIQAERIALFTDIHVKHAETVSAFSIIESAQRAITRGSDGLIVTGKWTGNAPTLAELKSIREAVADFPVICGSGVDSKNIHELFECADGAIVSTSLKEGVRKQGEINVKGYEQRIDEERVRELVISI